MCIRDRGEAGVLDEHDLAGVIDNIRIAVVDRYGIDPHSVLLVRPQSIPTTSSGKIQRGQCRQQFLDDALAQVASWQTASSVDDLARARELEKAVAGAELVRLAIATGGVAREG